jgi:hypothetical protein
MKETRYKYWLFMLSVILMLAPLQHLHATVKKSTDVHGTIHINNINEDKAKSQKGDNNNQGRHENSDVVRLHEPTPSNIFPEPGEVNTLPSMTDSQAQNPES